MDAAVIFPEDRGLCFKVLPSHLKMVEEALPGVRVRYSPDGKDLMEEGFAAEIIIAWGDPKFLNVDYCLWDQNLRWIHCLSAGVDNLMTSPVVKIPGLHVTNSQGIHEIPISEHVVGFLLCYYRKFREIYENQKKSRWFRAIDPRELSGRTVCIVGAGSIGRGIAKRLKAFDITVLGVKRSPAVLEHFDQVYTTEYLDEALAPADIIIMAAPLTPETQNIFNRERFEKLERAPVFINVGRGKTVDTDALIEALESGKLSGAMLDAVEPEPLAPDHPLWQMENVLVSPHISADSDRYFERAFQKFAAMAEYYRQGQPFPAEIDFNRNY